MQYMIITYVKKGGETSEDATINMTAKVQSYLNVGWVLRGELIVSNGVFYQVVTSKE